MEVLERYLPLTGGKLGSTSIYLIKSFVRFFWGLMEVMMS